jgi:hypothetical protein
MLSLAASSESLVGVVQYGDEEYKECWMHAEMLQVRHRNEGPVTFTYMHRPLLSVHRKPFQAAEAADSARSQGQFWQLHNRLISNSGNLRLAELYEYAESIGLDIELFTLEVDEDAHAQTVQRHIDSGMLAGGR